MTDTLDIDDDVVVTTPRKQAAAARPASPKDRLLADLQRRREAAAQIVPIGFEGEDFVAFFRLPDNGEELAEISARSEKRAKKDGTGGVWFNRLLLARFNTELRIGDERLVDSDGNAWTFAHPDCIESFGAISAPDCVLKAYVTDGFVSTVAMKLLSRAGFADRDDAEVVEDPTRTG